MTSLSVPQAAHLQSMFPRAKGTLETSTAVGGIVQTVQSPGTESESQGTKKQGN